MKNDYDVPKDHLKVIDEIMSGAKTVEYNGNVLTNIKINNIKKQLKTKVFYVVSLMKSG